MLDDDGDVPLSLRADVTAVVYGDAACGDTCAKRISGQLRKYGRFASLCAEILDGEASWPRPHLWMPALRSQLPVWGLLARAGYPAEEPSDAAWLQLFPRLISAVKGWWNNQCRLLDDSGGKYYAEKPGFARFLKQVKLWPSLPMQVEMLLTAAFALRVGLEVDLPMRRFKSEPCVVGLQLEVVALAADYFVELAAMVAGNTTDDLSRKPGVLGTLVAFERMRMSSWHGIASYLPQRHVAVFAGAHSGTVLLYYMQTWPEATVHAFEADPFLFRNLKRNLKKNPNTRLTLTEAALSARDRQWLTLRTRNGVGSQSTLWESTDFARSYWPEIMQSLAEGSRFTVRTVAIGPWAKKHGVHKLDLIYLDIECSEMSALRGARELLSNVTVIHIEVQTVATCKDAPLWPEVRRFLRSRGFRPLFVPPQPWRPIMDIVAIRDPWKGGMIGNDLVGFARHQRFSPLAGARSLC